VPCRVHLKEAGGKVVKAAGLPFWHDHFVCPGQASLELTAGDYAYELERGPEYTAVAGKFTVASGVALALTNELRRLTDLAAEGWWSGDLHVHRDPAQAELLLAAEDLHVAQFITWWNKNNTWAGQPLPANPLRRFDGPRFAHVLAGEDEREGGALLYFNLSAPYDITGGERLHPHSLYYAEAIRRQPAAWIDLEKPFWWDVPIWVAAGVGDSVGLANNHQQRGGMLDSEAWGKPRDRDRYPGPHGNGLWTQDIYYHLLNSGLRLPPSAGSASGVLANPLGYDRVYVFVEGELSWEKWWASLRAGRCFVSNGPLLRCRASGQWPGHIFKAAKGESITVELTVQLDSRDPIARLELIQNGRVEQGLPSAELKQGRRLSPPRFRESGWFLVRAVADTPHTFRFASTAPFYVEIGGQRHVEEPSVQFFLDWLRERRAATEKLAPEHRAEALRYVEQAERFWQGRLAAAKGQN
jgi:hypothetical protein